MYPVNCNTLLILSIMCTLICHVAGQGGRLEDSPSFHRVRLRFRPDGSLSGSQGSELDRFFSGTGSGSPRSNNRNRNDNGGGGRRFPGNPFMRMRRPFSHRFFSWFG